MARNDDDQDDDFDDEDDDRPVKKRRKSRSGGSPFVDFLLFKKMVGPTILMVLYWLVVLAMIGGGLVAIVMSLIAIKQAGALALVGVFYGLGIMVFGPIVYRVVFELMIIQFRIYDTLTEIRDKL